MAGVKVAVKFRGKESDKRGPFKWFKVELSFPQKPTNEDIVWALFREYSHIYSIKWRVIA